MNLKLKTQSNYILSFENPTNRLFLSTANNGGYRNFIKLGTTGNCQLTTYGYINYIIHHPIVKVKNYINVQNDIIRHLKKNSNKQILIDVLESEFDDIIEIFKRNSEDFHILIKNKYQNSTGNNMILCMFKWDKYDLDSEHPDYEEERDHEWDYDLNQYS